MKKRLLGAGVLTRDFTIHNSVYTVCIPRDSLVSFLYDEKTQVVNFVGIPVSIFRKEYQGEFGKWIADVYGRRMTVHFDASAPYPLSYFQK